MELVSYNLLNNVNNITSKIKYFFNEVSHFYNYNLFKMIVKIIIFIWHLALGII